MFEAFANSLGTPFQGATFAVIITAFFTALGIWFRHGPDRVRAENERFSVQAKIEEDLRSDAAKRFQEFRKEVHELRNELHAQAHEVIMSKASAQRCSDNLRIMSIAVKLLADKLRKIDPDSPELAHADLLLEDIITEPGDDPNDSRALKKAKGTVKAAKATVEEVKDLEAGGGK